jgi:hypothetical protein
VSINEVAMSRRVGCVSQVSETVCRHHSTLSLIGGTKGDINLNFFRGKQELRAKRLHFKEFDWFIFH